MTQFGAGLLNVRQRFGGQAPIGRVGIGSLEAPGGESVAFIPVPVNDSDDTNEQLAIVLGTTANTFGVVGQLAEQASRAERGAATRYAAEQWPSLQKRITDRELLPPDGADPTEWAASIAVGLAPPNSSEAYRSELRARLGPAINEAALKQQGLIKEEATDALMLRLGDSLAGQRDATAFGETLAEAVSIGVPAEQARTALGTTAAAWAAEAGDQEAWNTALGFLEGRNALKIEALRGRLHATIRQQEADVRDRANVELSEVLLQAKDPASGTTWEDARATVRKLGREAGPQWELEKLEGIDRAEAQFRAGILEEQARVFDVQTRNELVSSALAASFETDTGLGLAAIPEEGITWTNPAGKERTITAKELASAVRQEAFARIERETANPQQRMMRQAQWLAANNQIAPEWGALMETGAGSVTSMVLRRANDKGLVPADLPKSVQDGYALSKQLRAIDPTLWQRHVSRETAEFYARAEAAELYTDRGDVQGALIRAATVPDGWSRDPIGERDLDDAVRFAAGTINEQDVRAHTAVVAELYMRSPGLGKKTAIEEAAKLVQSQYRNIRGTMVWTGNVAVPSNIDGIANVVAARYAEMVRGSTFAVDEEDLTLVPLRQGETWILFDKLRNRPVEKWRYGFALTNQELREIDAQGAKVALADRRKALDEAWQLARPDRAETLDGRIDAVQQQIDGIRNSMGPGGIPHSSVITKMSRLVSERDRLLEIKQAREADPIK